MSEELKSRTIHSFKWSFIEKLVSFSFSFVVGILVARVLNPVDYGVMGLIAIFISLSQIIIDGGFSLALIQKKEVTEEDYSTVFFINIGLGLILYLIIFSVSSLVAEFYEIMQMKTLLKIVGLNIVINSLSVVQTAKLTKELNIKIQSKISLFALLISGTSALVMVYNGLGIWTLVFQVLIKNGFNTILLWWNSNWRPQWVLHMSSVKSMFKFSGNILTLGILGVVYDNMFSMIIGKTYSSKEVGFYAKANQVQQMPLSLYTSSLTKIILPILSEADLSMDRLKKVYSDFIVFSAMIIFPIMFILGALSKPLILFLFTDKWADMSIYLKVMALYGVFYPLIAINLNLLLVRNQSGLYLKLDVFKFVMAFILVVVARNSVFDLLIGFGVFYTAGYLLHAWITSRLIGYRLKEQFLDIFRPTLFSIVTYAVVAWSRTWVESAVLQILIGGILGLVFYSVLNLLFNKQKVLDVIDVLKTLRNR